ncbi:MAG: hypothetical protein GY730_04545 [bacterium]|nr:hypothetical protein [bacterium]
MLNIISKYLNFFSQTKDNYEIIEQAFDISLNTLRKRYTSTGITAGKTHFSDIWLRDSCYASFGSLAVRDYDIVRTNLITNLTYAKKNGQIPLRIGQKYMLLKFMGFKGKSKPRYIEDKGVSIPTDGNSLFIITAEAYISLSRDKNFAIEYFDKLKTILEWNFSMDEDSDLLIEEGPYAGWADSLKKRGKVLYTNVLHFKAVDSFAKICSLINKKDDQKHYERLRNLIRKGITERFWNRSYFIDWIHRHKHMYFSTDGNVLAIIFGLADKEQALKIQSCIHNFDLDHTFSTKSNFPEYRFRHIFPLFYPIRIPDYHNGLQWLWLGCADAIAKQRTGLKQDAYELLIRIAKKIVEYKGVYEVYQDGKPLKRIFYKSEQGFAWSSGMFVWACKELGIK